MQIFFLNGLWRFLKDGHLPVKLHSGAPPRITLKVTSTYDIRFFQSTVKSVEIRLLLNFSNAIAGHCQFSLTEVTVIRKIHRFLIVNKRVKVVWEVSFWYKSD